jgi:hypothetical protein
VNLVKEIWVPLEHGETTGYQFTQNLKRLKKATMEWARRKKSIDDQKIMNIEATLQSLYESKGGGFETQEPKEEMLNLEKARRKLLEAKQA